MLPSYQHLFTNVHWVRANWQPTPDPFTLFHSGEIKIPPIPDTKSFSLLHPLSLSSLLFLSQTLLPHRVLLPNPWPPFALPPSSALPSREPRAEPAGPPRRGPINRPRFAVMMPLLMSVQLLQCWIGRINVGSSTSASLFHCHYLLSCVADRGGTRWNNLSTPCPIQKSDDWLRPMYQEDILLLLFIFSVLHIPCG